MPEEDIQTPSVSIVWGKRSVVARLQRSNRRVLKVEIDPEGRVTVFAPEDAQPADIARRVARKGAWIFRELDTIAARPATSPQRRYISGETHLFMGRQFRLQIDPAKEPYVRCEGARMVIGARDPEDQDHCRRMIRAFYALNARAVFPERLDAQIVPFLRKGLKRPPLIIRRLVKRWGSFTPNGRIVLNVDLIRAAPDLIDYVLCHELAHGLCPDHGAEWRALLSSVMPDWGVRKERLEATLR